MKILSEKQFLNSKGLGDAMSGFCIDKLANNRQIRTVRGKKRFDAECDKAEAEYQERRAAAKAEYAALVSRGEVRPPTFLERALDAAKGHPDNSSTQAARRILAKKGIDWETGKAVEGV